MIRPHTDNYRPPPDGLPSLTVVICVLAGVGLSIAGTIALLVRCVTWLLK